MSDFFLDYLDDFEEDDNQDHGLLQENNNIEMVNNPVGPVPHQQIDQRWVSVDASNILPGGRTRNRRQDYAVFR